MWALLVLKAILAIVILLLLFYRLWFLRDPARPMPKEGVLSPADGTIERIIPFTGGKAKDIPKGMLGRVRAWTADVAKEGWIIVIVMTPMDMHHQKAPCDARVMGIKHADGKFLNAVAGASSLKPTFENENNSILLETKHGRMKIIQVAGFLCRRIVCHLQPGRRLRRGDDLGLIKMGSQVCLIMPKLPLKVKEGQHVLARRTVVA